MSAIHLASRKLNDQQLTKEIARFPNEIVTLNLSIHIENKAIISSRIRDYHLFQR